MTIRLFCLAAIAITSLATLTSDATAGCSSRVRHHYPRHHHTYVRHVRPVTVVRPTVQVVQPAIATPPPEAAFPAVPAGSTLTIPANFLGNEPGSVFMVFQDIKLPVQISGWNMTGVTITLPPMAVKDAVLIRLDVVLPDGRLGHSQKLNVTAPAPVVLHPVAPTAPLPTNAALSMQP